MTALVAYELRTEALVSGTPTLTAYELRTEALVSGTPTLTAYELRLEVLVGQPASSLVGEVTPGGIVLAEVTGYDPVADSNVTLRISNRGYTTLSTDTPPNTAYIEVMTGVPRFVQDAKSANAGAGEIRFNASAYPDLWRVDFALKTVTLRYGSRGQSIADFDVIAGLVIDEKGIQFDSQTTARFSLLNKIRFLYKQFAPSELMSNGLNMPLTFGYCRNVKFAVEDAATRKFRCHPDNVGGVAAFNDVYDGGNALTVTTEYTVLNDSDGKPIGVTLTSADAVRELTGDISGALLPAGLIYEGIDLAGVAVDNITAFFYVLLQYSSYFTEADLNPGNLVWLFNRFPQKLGLHIPSDNKNVMIAELMRPLLDSLELFFRQNLAGQIEVGSLRAPTGGAAELAGTYTTDHMRPGSLRPLGTEPPLKTLRLGYDRNWTPLKRNELASGLTESQKQPFIDEYTWLTGNNTVTSNAWTDAIVETALTDATEAATEAARRLTERADRRQYFEVVLLRECLHLLAGYEIHITYSKFGFDSGKYCRVVYVERIENNAVRIRFFT